ncbi:MAG: homoserine dehydrogenase [Lachnospiraceae bacterium]|nr:homoserine dehydrogenase [Lachnospiraceae bacterium]
MIKAAVMGYGTIGSGVVEILQRNSARVAKNAGAPIEVKYVLDLRDFPGDPVEKILVRDYKTIAEDPEVKIVVETMGGVEPAFTFVKAMLEAGKNVCTSNKALVADKGAELIALAAQKNVNFLFEASVGGGIPIIRPLLTSITGDEIDEISGIINGTTNYMLTKMTYEGLDFDSVLKEAQALGYAEKDPTADVEGHDVCRKIAILTSIVLGQQVNYTDIHTEGITGITPVDIRYADAMDCVIKLIAKSVRTESGYVAIVSPQLIAREHPLYQVNGVFNAIFVKGNMLGDSMFYGSGAGKLPTASAVVGDIIDMARHIDEHIRLDWEPESYKLVDYLDNVVSFFVRTEKSQEEIKAVFGDVEFVEVSGIEGECGFRTAPMTEREFAEKAEKLGIISRIRFN